MNTNMNKFIHLLDCFHRIIVFLGQETWCYREDWEDEGPRVCLSEDWSGQRGSDLRQTWQVRLAPSPLPLHGETSLFTGVQDKAAPGGSSQGASSLLVSHGQVCSWGPTFCLLVHHHPLHYVIPQTSLQTTTVPLPGPCLSGLEALLAVRS